ncbi:hypothetical protein Tco_0730603 [Tanacetum coccineum]|uniref:Uncharacterized protein n=1 Tax=Tanacetum coccineum TaxID=301880 RepID=A0ABQ4YUZ1_9ASTR
MNANLLWPGTFAFVDWLVQQRLKLQGRRIIELGRQVLTSPPNGTGALAIFLNKLYQVDITTSDYDDQEIEDNIAHNCTINGVSPVLPHIKAIETICNLIKTLCYPLKKVATTKPRETYSVINQKKISWCLDQLSCELETQNWERKMRSVYSQRCETAWSSIKNKGNLGSGCTVITP